MKKTTLFLFALLAFLPVAEAAIQFSPSSGVINVGQALGYRFDCNDGNQVNIYFGDGSVLLGVSPNVDMFIFHTYRNPGTFTFHKRLIFTVTPSCLWDEYRTVTVLENRTLTLDPAVPAAGQTVTFSAGNFNTPTDLAWDFGDGTRLSGQGSTVTHAYAQAGAYTLRVYDWNSNFKTTPVSMTVNVVIPVRQIVYTPELPRVDQEVLLQAANFRIDTIDWNFGDGTPMQTYSAAVAHRFQNPGTFTVSAIEHGYVNLAPATRAITILPDNRSLALSSPEVRVNEALTVTAVNFRGPLVLWNFGDGSTASTPVPVAARPSAFPGPLIVTHVYARPGNYKITARDESGASAKKFAAAVRVLGISDSVALEAAEIALDNGKYYQVVPRNSKAIRARLQMKMRGTGIVSGYWIVDGQPSYFFNETAYQGQVKTIPTPEVPGLPTFDPGMHTITLQLTRPSTTVAVFPTLRYFVLPYENIIALLGPNDGAVLKEDAVASFSWERALGGSRYQIAFSPGLFPLLRADADLAWRECPEGTRYTPDAETWRAIGRDRWTFWKVRAVDGAGVVVAESGIREMKVIVPGARIGIRRITDLDGRAIASAAGEVATRADRLLVHGTLTYPAPAEYLVLRVYAGGELVDQLLFRDVRQDEERPFETSLANPQGGSRVAFEVLKSSSPSVLVGYEELQLKRE
jgi:PKD repeat protein